MKLTRSPRRALAAIAIASVAILVPAVALASSATTAAPKAPAVTRCRVSQVTPWLGIPGDQSAGSTSYQLEISNISRHTCTLYGYPGVLATRDGSQLGSPAGRNPSHPRTLLVLRPGSTVHVILRIADVYNYPPGACKPAKANMLKVYAPGDFGWHYVPLTFEACSKKGPVYLQVSTAISGTGIPLYSH